MAGSSSGDDDYGNANFPAPQILASKTKKLPDGEGSLSSSTLPQVLDPKLAVGSKIQKSINNIPRSGIIPALGQSQVQNLSNNPGRSSSAMGEKSRDAKTPVSRSLWENSLYGKKFGRTPPLALVQSVLPKIWKTNGSIQVINMALGFFCFKFANKDYLNKVLAGGSWFLRKQVLMLISWKVNFQPMLEKISSIPVWIQFPGLPLEYIQREILIKIASSIGQPLKIDEITLKDQRAKFAQICVLWDLDKIVPQGIWINCMRNKFWQAPAFENITRLCYTCDKVGHTSDQCSLKPETMEVKNSRAQQVEQLEYDISFGIPTRTESESLFGPWMVVNKKKKQSVRKKSEMEVKTLNGFGSLIDLNDELGNSTEKSNNLLHVNNDSSQKATALSMDFKMVASSNSPNPFGSKKDKKGKSSVMEDTSMMEIEEFSSCSPKIIPVHLNREKNAEALHKKLTDTFAITVSNIKVVEDLQQEIEDPDLLLIKNTI
ncbi:hypothetical protein Cni_G04929 [Canna indica]|uniref:CCHC-type domain-containing protein n=1 Tax=Canna indica TaxID=4628 RepID=A0AAQ3JUB5_9LILI|nr:hypothetical protein Cni_G04929 [Canna indica]